MIEDFYRYKEHTGLIRMRIPEVVLGSKVGQVEWKEYKPKYAYEDTLLLPLKLKISYADKNYDRGIKWMLRCDGRHYEAYSEYGIYAIINPKILLGIHDYLTAATCDDMNKAITNFNSISENISPLLRTFYDYTLKRTDYCVILPSMNFSLSVQLSKLWI